MMKGGRVVNGNEGEEAFVPGVKGLGKPSLIDGVLVFECERHLEDDELEAIRETMKAVFPERKVLLLYGGIKLHVAQSETLARIESKLDALIAAKQDGFVDSRDLSD